MITDTHTSCNDVLKPTASSHKLKSLAVSVWWILERHCMPHWTGPFCPVHKEIRPLLRGVLSLNHKFGISCHGRLVFHSLVNATSHQTHQCRLARIAHWRTAKLASLHGRCICSTTVGLVLACAEGWLRVGGSLWGRYRYYYIILHVLTHTIFVDSWSSDGQLRGLQWLPSKSWLIWGDWNLEVGTHKSFAQHWPRVGITPSHQTPTWIPPKRNPVKWPCQQM